MSRGGPCLPNLLVIGAAKAGTTSLHDYLSQHPAIFMSRHKELRFFSSEHRWSSGIEWYKSNFDDRYSINGESSPIYSRYPGTAGVPQRIREVLGAPKLIYIMRDPVDRLLAQYTEVLAYYEGVRPFHGILPEIENNAAGYISFSSYHLQLTQYLNVFPRDSIHTIILERLRADPRTELRNLFRFIGVDENFWCKEFDLRSNVGAQKRITASWFRRSVPSFVREEISKGEWLPWKVNQVVDKLSRVGGEPVRKPVLTPDEDLHLQCALRADVGSLRALLGDSLPEWRPYA